MITELLGKEKQSGWGTPCAIHHVCWKQGEWGLSGAVWLPESKLDEGNSACAE